MQTRTLTSKASLGWLSWRTFLPLFALFVGLGASHSVQAQQVDDNSISLNQQASGAASSQLANYRGSYFAGDMPYDGYTPLGQVTTSGTVVRSNPNIGTYDLNGTSSLTLAGTSLVAEDATGRGAIRVTGAQLYYRVYPSATTSKSTYAYTALSMVDGGLYNGVSGSHNFSATSSANLLAGLTVGGNYTIEVYFVINKSDGTQQQDPAGYYQASFVLNAPTPPSFVAASPNTILINPNNSGDVSYTTTAFNGANLGDFDVNTGKLLLDGGTSTTTENGNNNITDVSLYYRVHSSTTAGGGFNFVSLAQTQVVTNADGTRTRSFSLNSAAQNLLNNINIASGYNVDTYFVASYTNGSNNFTVRDDNGGNYYVANFSVTGTAIVTVVWTGGIDDNWFNPNNWNPKQIPTATTNARIPDFPSGSNITYPNIYSDVVKQPVGEMTTTNPDGTKNIIPATPGYDNRGSGNAVARDLTMSGTSPTQRSILRLIVGRLDVFGDFNNTQQSFIQRAGTTISFKSQGNQTISGNTNGFTNVEIDGAAGSIKTLSSAFSIKAGGSLKFINGILQTDISQTDTNYISFDAATTEPGTGIVTPAGRLLNETNTSFFRGYLITTQTSAPGSTQDFSNIGLSTTFTGLDPGPIFVSRNTAGNYAPTAFGGATPKPGIRRVFGVQPNNPGTNTAGLNAVVQFAYLDNELVNLRVNTTNPPDYSGSVDKAKLALYVSTTGGNTFSQLGRDSNNNNILVKSGVTTFATFTLSEQQTPLPVKLISFEAKRTGANALITWATAVEISNSGFEVQVSTDGTTFRKLAFLASQAINSTSVLKYSFLDDEVNKTGTRYYRLRQIDEDGKDDFSPVRVVSFSAASADQATTLTSYPNPFNNSDLPIILVQSATAGDAALQVMDMMGRVVARQVFATVAGIQEVAIPQASTLSSGVYVAKVTLATGEVKTIRIQKR